MHGEKDEIIYVGKAISLKNRVRQYFQPSRNRGAKIDQMVTHITRFEYIVTDSELEALVRAGDHHHRRHLKPAVGAEADAACCLFLRSESELPPLLRNRLDREVVTRERKLPVGVPDGLAVRALRKTPHEACHGLKEAVRADASNSARHLLHPRHGVGVHEVGVLLIGLRKRLRRPELAVELPEIIRLVHLRVVDDHLRS